MKYLIFVGILTFSVLVPAYIGGYVITYGMPAKVEQRATEASSTFIVKNQIEDVRTSCNGSMVNGYTRCLLSSDTKRPILLKCPTGFYLNKVQNFYTCAEQVYPTVNTAQELTRAN
jgi:hypothetical protein